ncbi:MAG: hypothetical protein DI632_03995 [Sphingomonas hengshuiensis]|uniref:Uncharacterized protein n=2 Tax=Sphingomonas TaxID=13687 RepID=A0A2W5BA52_9SPHN|nr:MAG: hypothetical protein DI632_03995 [Sphingomonas hengshuiensis]
MVRNPLQGSVVPFARRWHVIQEIDLMRLIGGHGRRLALCDQAERIADALPHRPDATTLAAFLAALEDQVVRGEEAEDAFLATMLLNGRDDPLAQTLLGHVRWRHAADGAAARELIAAFVEADVRVAPETLGHMLRGFFAGCRHAVAFEQLTIVALAGHRLTADAGALLADALAESAAA